MAFVENGAVQPDGRISCFHLVVLAMSLLLTLGAYLFAERQIEGKVHSRFGDARDRALGLISDRMQKYEDTLWSGVAAIESHGGDVTLAEWRSFTDALRIEERYAGINGIGVIHLVDRSELDAFLAVRRRERPSFQIYPPHENEPLMPISFIEPVTVNAAAVGLDVAHERNRRTAAQKALQSGDTHITGPIVLVQDADSTPGFLFYAPFYSNGEASGSREAKGLVYAPFVVKTLVDGLLAKKLRGVHFSITDAGETIYDEHDPDDPLHDPDPMLSETVKLDLYGRVWTIDFRTNLAFRAANAYAQPTIILLSGLLIEGLIIALIVMMARTNRKAIAYARKVNAELRVESARLEETNRKLAAANEDIEQFTYITSHDLKTPIRGIAGLTELLEEDLAEYLASDDANPDVAANLELIRERVRRMSSLIRAIMEYSRIGVDSNESAPVRIAELIDGMRADFGLSDVALKLESDRTWIDVKPGDFHRVLENLVGNAVRHYEGEAPLEILVTIESVGEIVRVTVEDNGPGIDPRFHDRIFDVFQTLRTAETPESTGIGLAMVRKAVEHHGGSVRVISRPGEGAAFIFEWPLGMADTQAETVAVAA